ncbi:MAG: type III pantothenate kinase, partial [Acidobacteria bacterium]
MLLAVDIGNTATKLAIFQDGKIKNRSIIPT